MYINAVYYQIEKIAKDNLVFRWNHIFCYSLTTLGQIVTNIQEITAVS